MTQHHCTNHRCNECRGTPEHEQITDNRTVAEVLEQQKEEK